MTKTITIRDIPAPLHHKLKKRAAAAGLSLPRYVLRELKRFDAEMRTEADRVSRLPSLETFLERLRSRPGVRLSVSAAEIIRQHRGPLP